jgi:hypothetical protein
MSDEKIIAARLEEKDGPPYWFVALSSEPTSFLEVNMDPRGCDIADIRKLFEVRVDKKRGTRTMTMRIARRFLRQIGAEFLE